MSCVARSLLEEMAEDPAKIHDRLAVGRPTGLVERGLCDQGIRLVAHGTATTCRSIDRRFVFSDVCSVVPAKRRSARVASASATWLINHRSNVPEATGDAAASTSSSPSNFFRSEVRWHASSEVRTARSPTTRGGFSSDTGAKPIGGDRRGFLGHSVRRGDFARFRSAEHLAGGGGQMEVWSQARPARICSRRMSA